MIMNKYEEVFAQFNLDQKDSEIIGNVATILGKSEKNRTEKVLNSVFLC